MSLDVQDRQAIPYKCFFFTKRKVHIFLESGSGSASIEQINMGPDPEHWCVRRRGCPEIPRFNPAIPRFISAIPRFKPAIPRFNPAIQRFIPALPRFSPAIPRFIPALPRFNPAIPRFNPSIMVSFFIIKVKVNFIGDSH